MPSTTIKITKKSQNDEGLAILKDETRRLLLLNFTEILRVREGHLNLVCYTGFFHSTRFVTRGRTGQSRFNQDDCILHRKYSNNLPRVGGICLIVENF